MHPIFARLRHRLDRAKQELTRIEAAARLLAALPADETTAWVRRNSLASGIEAVYTEIENVLKVIAAEIDGYVPTGEDWHAKLLETMTLSIPDIRPAVLLPTTRAELDELRRFRHVVRNRYALELSDEGIDANLQRLETVLPVFGDDLKRFIRAMSSAAKP